MTTNATIMLCRKVRGGDKDNIFFWGIERGDPETAKHDLKSAPNGGGDVLWNKKHWNGTKYPRCTGKVTYSYQNNRCVMKAMHADNDTEAAKYGWNANYVRSHYQCLGFFPLELFL